MNGIEKIQPEHREKRVFVYARRSTPAQVMQHHTSTERQLELTKLAVRLGWAPTQVDLVADDLGRSESSQRTVTASSASRRRSAWAASAQSSASTPRRD
jgi:hypothetical protein